MGNKQIELLDYFAGLAMQSLILLDKESVKESEGITQLHRKKALAITAYEIADEMYNESLKYNAGYQAATIRASRASEENR